MTEASGTGTAGTKTGGTTAARTEARAQAERAARASYGRLVAILARRSSDIASAEDALSEAFAAALTHWPETGVPNAPEAWLVTVAKRALGRAARAADLRRRAQGLLEIAYESAGAARMESEETAQDLGFPDERLALMFVCAHPAIDPAIRAPLMLQTVLGLDAARIAAAFVIPPATMGQRLSRAKAKIRDAGVAFDPPAPAVAAERLDDVLNAIYAAYGAGWDAVDGGSDGARGLTRAAIELGRAVATLAPTAPEPKGLLALMLYCEARRDARRGGDGRFIPLGEQDPTLWSWDMIIEAESLLTEAAQRTAFGRYQCEAAVQSVHCQRARTGRTEWPAILTLYDLLAARAPSLGVFAARAATLVEMGRSAAALDALDAVDPGRARAYQPLWVARAAALTALDRRQEAAEAARQAVSLTRDPSLARYLRERFSV